MHNTLLLLLKPMHESEREETCVLAFLPFLVFSFAKLHRATFIISPRNKSAILRQFIMANAEGARYAMGMKKALKKMILLLVFL